MRREERGYERDGELCEVARGGGINLLWEKVEGEQKGVHEDIDR